MKTAKELALEQAQIASDFYTKCLNNSNEAAPRRNSSEDRYSYESLIKPLAKNGKPLRGRDDTHALQICKRIGHSYLKSVRLLKDRYSTVALEYKAKRDAVTFEKYPKFPFLRHFGKVTDRDKEISKTTIDFIAGKASELAINSTASISNLTSKSPTFEIPANEWTSIRGTGNTMIEEISFLSKRVEEFKTRLNRRTAIALTVTGIVVSVILKVVIFKDSAHLK